MNKTAQERSYKLFDGIKSELTETDVVYFVCITWCSGKRMLHAALNSGLEPEVIKEVIYQATTDEKTRFNCLEKAWRNARLMDRY